MKTILLSILLSFGFALHPINAQNTADFKLLNKSAKSIPLIIPGVMNPNLSPFSSSGVELKEGQKILFKYKGKRRVLLIVTKDLDGTKVIVNELLRKRKKEIDQEKKE